MIEHTRALVESKYTIANGFSHDASVSLTERLSLQMKGAINVRCYIRTVQFLDASVTVPLACSFWLSITSCFKFFFTWSRVFWP